MAVLKRFLILLALLFLLVLLTAAPIRPRYVFSTGNDPDGNTAVNLSGANYLVVPSMNGNPDSASAGAIWLNIAPGCGFLMKKDANGPDCLDVASCPAECLQ